jgi:uncharacterized cupredoxin-like copper-binding protein
MKFKNARLFVFLPVIIGLVAIALAGCGGTTQQSQTVTVQLSEFKIEASQTTFAPGRAYHFVVTNQGAADHEFMIMPESMHGMSMGDMHAMALAMIDKIPPGQTQTLDFTFEDASAQSDFEFACYYPGHYEAGMKQGIAVQQ